MGEVRRDRVNGESCTYWTGGEADRISGFGIIKKCLRLFVLGLSPMILLSKEC